MDFKYEFMKRNLITALLFVAALLSNAQTDKSNLYGVYCREVKHCCISSDYIQILPDSTFFYWTGESNAALTHKGNWKLNGNILILNSDLQPDFKTDDYRVSQLQAVSDSATTILITNESGQPLPGARCIAWLNEETFESFTNLNGEVSFQLKCPDKLMISFPGFKTALFENNRTQHHDFVFALKEQYINWQCFTNKELIVKGKRLYCTKPDRVKRKHSLFRVKKFYKKINT